MKIMLMKLEQGFLERLSDSPDHWMQIDRWDMERWLKDRHLDVAPCSKKENNITIMTMAKFLEFINSPVLEVLPLTTIPIDRRPQETMHMMKLYTVGATHAECTHVVIKN